MAAALLTHTLQRMRAFVPAGANVEPQTVIAHTGTDSDVRIRQKQTRNGRGGFVTSFYIALSVYLIALVAIVGWWSRFPR